MLGGVLFLKLLHWRCIHLMLEVMCINIWVFYKTFMLQKLICYLYIQGSKSPLWVPNGTYQTSLLCKIPSNKKSLASICDWMDFLYFLFFCWLTCQRRKSGKQRCGFRCPSSKSPNTSSSSALTFTSSSHVSAASCTDNFPICCTAWCSSFKASASVHRHGKEIQNS